MLHLTPNVKKKENKGNHSDPVNGAAKALRLFKGRHKT